MPPRTSRTRTSSPSRAATPVVSHDTRHTIASHGSLITILWVTVLFLSIGFGLTLFVHRVRIDSDDRLLIGLSQRVDDLSQQAALLRPPSVPVVPTPSVPVATTLVTTNLSASGLLERGSLSPDGTRYAGYDVTTKGKMGIGVEIQATKVVKHIVLFNPNTESTGKGTPDESTMSARWKDANTIEYDILIKKGSTWVKQVQTVKIYF